MVIRTVNVDEYIQCMTALGGGYPADMKRQAGESGDYARKRFGILEKRNILENLTEGGMKMYVLGSAPASIPEELKTYYTKQTGGRRPYGYAPVQRAIFRSRTAIFMNGLDIHIDGIRIAREKLGMGERAGERKERPVIYEDRTMEELVLGDEAMTYRQIAQSTDSNIVNFFTYRTVKTAPDASDSNGEKRRANEATRRLAQSSLMGHLLGGGISYPVYMASGSSRQLLQLAEKQTVDFLLRISEDIYGREYADRLAGRYPHGQAILLTESEEEIGLFLMNELDRRRDSIRPAEIFSSCLIVPAAERGRAMMDMLLVPGWSDMFREAVFEREELALAEGESYMPAGVERTEEGDRLWYELVSMDICTVAMIGRLADDMDAALSNMENDGYSPADRDRRLSIGIVCLDWQKDIIEEALNECLGRYRQIRPHIEYMRIAESTLVEIMKGEI